MIIRNLMRAVLLTTLLATVRQASAQPTTPAEQLSELKGETQATQHTSEQLEAAYRTVLQSLLPKMSSTDPNERKTPEQDWQRVCWHAGRPGAEAQRLAACRAMAAKLVPDTPQPARLWLLKQLQYIGRAEAVPAITVLLDGNDSILRERARQALSGNPSEAAAKALRSALQKAREPDWRVALVNALGSRCEKGNLDALADAAKTDNHAVRNAAMVALAKTGDPAAVKAIVTAAEDAPTQLRKLSGDAMLRLAETLCERGDFRAAREAYETAHALRVSGDSGGERRGHVLCAILVGLGRVGAKDEMKWIEQFLAATDPKVAGAATSALELLPGTDVTRFLCRRLRKVDAELKGTVLQALARRGDVAAVPEIVRAAKHDDEAVRIAAYRAIGRLGGEQAADTLVRGMLDAGGDERKAAADALSRIPGESAVDAIVRGLRKAAPPGRVELVKTLAPHRSARVTPTLLETTGDPEAQVRLEALKALGDLGEDDTVAPLVGRLVKADDAGDRDAIAAAIVAVCRRSDAADRGLGPVLLEFPGASVAAKCALLRAAGKVGGNTALGLVTPALATDNGEIQDAAVRALADWPDLDAAPRLLGVAHKSTNEVHRVLALRAYVRVLGSASDVALDRKLEMYRDGLRTARRPEDKKLVFGGLATIGAIAAVDLIKPHLADQSLRAEAAMAIITVAESVGSEQRAAAEAALSELAATCSNDTIATRVEQAMSHLARYDGYITAWQVTKAYKQGKNKNQALLDTAFAPEEEQPKEDVKWDPVTPRRDPTTAWEVNIGAILGGSNCVAYLRSWLRSDRDQPARLELGSDDGVKVWLNGKIVHSNNSSRALQAAEDKVDVDLVRGWNALLLKIAQGSGDWAACCRVRDKNGDLAQSVLVMGEPSAFAAAAMDLADDALRKGAADVVLNMADVLSPVYPAETKQALEQAVAASKDEAVRKHVTAAVEKAAMYEDYMTEWEVSGPFMAATRSAGELIDIVFQPEKAGHGQAEWRPLPVGQDPTRPWCLLLEQAIGGEQRVAYLRTHVWSPQEQPARLDMGSDDGIKAWLNAELVHNNNAFRPLTAGSDKAAVTLVTGWNSLLLKITQGGGHWAACARLRDPNGFHLDGLKAQASPPAGLTFTPDVSPDAPKKQ